MRKSESNNSIDDLPTLRPLSQNIHSTFSLFLPNYNLQIIIFAAYSTISKSNHIFNQTSFQFFHYFVQNIQRKINVFSITKVKNALQNVRR